MFLIPDEIQRSVDFLVRAASYSVTHFLSSGVEMRACEESSNRVHTNSHHIFVFSISSSAHLQNNKIFSFINNVLSK